MAAPHPASRRVTSPHIDVALHELGHLIENHDLDYLWVEAQREPGRPTWHTMAFGGDLMPRLQEALASLDPKHLHDLFLLNNHGPNA